MAGTQSHQPTLWRTCRAIANRRRLRIFGWLVQHPDQTVSAVARALRLPLSLTSFYLRTLEARGLLTVRRVGRFVRYQPLSATSQSSAAGLAAALTEAFQKESYSVEQVFRLATAFTHPRRIEAFRLLNQAPSAASQLRATTRISGWALARHLNKLEARGFIARRGELYEAVRQRSRLSLELARLATQSAQ